MNRRSISGLEPGRSLTTVVDANGAGGADCAGASVSMLVTAVHLAHHTSGRHSAETRNRL